MKIIVLVLLAAIVLTLFSGLFFLVKDKDHPNSPRLLTALKVRVGLSILLVTLLAVSYKMGWLTDIAG
ncbi:MAG: twin transmembrane helix small protein [Gammaproteobacteria bacterium]|nr:twin transmembrane helix small protein [Gammaproteobacteria bacterium]